MTYYVYIMTNKWNTVLYTGVTNDLIRRVSEHKAHVDSKAFTTKYQLEKFVHYESGDDSYSAIMREKQIKASSRKRKMELINSMHYRVERLSR